jgi:hypothetical protein
LQSKYASVCLFLTLNIIFIVFAGFIQPKSFDLARSEVLNSIFLPPSLLICLPYIPCCSTQFTALDTISFPSAVFLTIFILLNLLMAFSSTISQDLNYTNWGSWVEYDIKSGQLVQFRPRIEPVVMPDWKVGEVIFWFWCLYINFLLDMASQ